MYEKEKRRCIFAFTSVAECVIRIIVLSDNAEVFNDLPQILTWIPLQQGQINHNNFSQYHFAFSFIKIVQLG